MSDIAYVIAGYGVILGGLAAYAALLVRRLAQAAEPLEGERVGADVPAPPAGDTASGGGDRR